VRCPVGLAHAPQAVNLGEHFQTEREAQGPSAEVSDPEVLRDSARWGLQQSPHCAISSPGSPQHSQGPPFPVGGE
jgi:hypothetical protein